MKVKIGNNIADPHEEMAALIFSGRGEIFEFVKALLDGVNQNPDMTVWVAGPESTSQENFREFVKDYIHE